MRSRTQLQVPHPLHPHSPSSRFSHLPFKNKEQKQEFIEDNEEYLIDLHNKRGETEFGDFFVEYLKKNGREHRIEP